jgi:3'-phosphoadenosine 5'-phosphosulfate sulfotransferase (PAPS reductase)/FAD synthetase
MSSVNSSDKCSESLNSFIEVVKNNGVESIFVLFSGGRDSLVALHLSREVSERLGVKLSALHVDTTVSTPGNLEYVEEVCREFGVDLIVLRPKRDFFSLVGRWGFPTATRRWCCYHLKIEPLKKFFKNIDTSGVLVADGIRAEESWRRRGFPKLARHRHFNCLNYHPIFEWSKEDVLKYIKVHKLRENPLYSKLPRVTECWCTAFKTVRQFTVLRQEWPELFNKFVEAEANLKTGGSALFKGRKKVYLKDL